MAWFKVDDGFATSPKVLSIPRPARLAAIGLWAIAGTWCSRHLTDGRVPTYMLEEWGADLSHGTALVASGLWVQTPEGFAFHDWGDYQPSKSETIANRERERQRKEQWRAKKAENAGESPNGTGEGRDKPSHRLSALPDPTRPDPTRPVPKGTSERAPRSSTKRGERLANDWQPSADSVAKAKIDAPHVNLRHEHEVFVDYWISQPGQKGLKLDWDATWRNWMRRKESDFVSPNPAPSSRRRAPTRGEQNLSYVAQLEAQQIQDQLQKEIA
jgi:hypothetical protein